jgi:hypothetical protein
MDHDKKSHHSDAFLVVVDHPSCLKDVPVSNNLRKRVTPPAILSTVLYLVPVSRRNAYLRWYPSFRYGNPAKTSILVLLHSVRKATQIEKVMFPQ